MAENDAREARACWIEERRRNEAERFDTRFAPTYDRDWGEVMPTHAQMLERFVSLCPPGAAILDAACGTGKYWPTVLASGRHPTGVDQSAGMLKQAARKHPEVPCLLQPLTAISAIAAFDGVLCVDAMEYVPPEEWPIVLAAFHRALRPGGHLYITVEQADPAVIEAETRRSAALGHPVVPGESVQGAGPEENDGYHFYPAHDRVLGWLAGAGFRLLEERLGDEYVHLLAQSA